MTIDLRPVVAADVKPLARICYEAFGALHERHSTPRDFDSLETAEMVIGMLASNPAFAGFAARVDGRLVGSNFISFVDEVAGVGPITVDPACQGAGVGKALMRAVLEEASRRGVQQVRLLQEAINTTSLSLYTSLGFEWRDSVAIMLAGGKGDSACRPMRSRDLDSVERIAERQYGASRRREAESALAAGLPAFVRESRGEVTAYLLPGFMGHGFGPDVESMAALVGHAATTAPAMFHRIFAPLSQGSFYRELLRRGCRTVKVMSYMTVGPYTPPRGVWMPSILN
ncbi:MAG: GNAT family N-acetyltransferase [Phycisphaeraceae bacterium]|nr:GNAT family N-acetyltransferase [Phycisphaeraceae bacterium]